MKDTLERKTCQEFRDTGLLCFINHILHAFGWAIVYDVKEDVFYPARTKFRGFAEESQSKSYKQIASYMKNTADELYDDTMEDEE